MIGVELPSYSGIVAFIGFAFSVGLLIFSVLKLIPIVKSLLSDDINYLPPEDAAARKMKNRIFVGVLAFVATAGFFYATGTDVGEASVLVQKCAAMCNVPESIRP